MKAELCPASAFDQERACHEPETAVATYARIQLLEPGVRDGVAGDANGTGPKRRVQVRPFASSASITLLGRRDLPDKARATLHDLVVKGI